MDVVRYGAEKATKTAEQTMVQARAAVGLLQIDDVKDSRVTAEPSGVLRIPESARQAANDQEWQHIITTTWARGVNAILKPDRPGIFISRNGRGSKVGVHAAAQKNGSWEFRAEGRPIQVLVLLAVESNGRIHDYVLPPKLVRDVWKQFERNGSAVSIRLMTTPQGPVLELTDKQIPLQDYEGAYLPLQ
jgi:hypothetical protein